MTASVDAKYSAARPHWSVDVGLLWWLATALAVTMGSRWAASRMPVPSRSVAVADAAAASATSGSRLRRYSSGSRPSARPG